MNTRQRKKHHTLKNIFKDTLNLSSGDTLCVRLDPMSTSRDTLRNLVKFGRLAKSNNIQCVFLTKNLDVSKVNDDDIDRLKDFINKYEEEKKKNVVYFELNNWFGGRDYPDVEPFSTWISTRKFSDPDWCKENKLAVKFGNIDMSEHYCISASREWVEKNCPDLLSDKTFEYTIITHSANGSETNTHTNSFANFLRYPNEDGDVYGKYGWKFNPYTKENFGVKIFCEDPFYDDDEDDEDEDD